MRRSRPTKHLPRIARLWLAALLLASGSSQSFAAPIGAQVAERAEPATRALREMGDTVLLHSGQLRSGRVDSADASQVSLIRGRRPA